MESTQYFSATSVHFRHLLVNVLTTSPHVNPPSERCH